MSAIFLNQTKLGAIFARIFRDFRQFKTFGARLHPRCLHHWYCWPQIDHKRDSRNTGNLVAAISTATHNSTNFEKREH